MWDSIAAVVSNAKPPPLIAHPVVPAPLQLVIASQPWELVAVDVLKVPISLQSSGYILVAQDYFSKCPFAVPIPHTFKGNLLTG